MIISPVVVFLFFQNFNFWVVSGGGGGWGGGGGVKGETIVKNDKNLVSYSTSQEPCMI